MGKSPTGLHGALTKSARSQVANFAERPDHSLRIGECGLYASPLTVCMILKTFVVNCRQSARQDELFADANIEHTCMDAKRRDAGSQLRDAASSPPATGGVRYSRAIAPTLQPSPAKCGWTLVAAKPRQFDDGLDACEPRPRNARISSHQVWS